MDQNTSTQALETTAKKTHADTSLNKTASVYLSKTGKPLFVLGS